jgi:hypothetical protein
VRQAERDAHRKKTPHPTLLKGAIKKRDHAQSMPACSPRSKEVILALDNQHGIYRDRRTVAEVARSPGATRPGQPISVSSAGALAPMRDRRAKPPPDGNVKVSKAVLLEASNHEA